jgi:hypothetical protein
MLDATQIFDGTLPNTGVAITTTRVSTNVLDMLTSRDIGNGNAVYCTVRILTALTGGTSLVISYQVSNTEGSGYVDLIASPVIVAANLIAGTKYGFVVPRNQFNNATTGVLAAPGRYHRLNYTVAGTFGAGTVMAYLTATPDDNCYYSYPNNYNANVYADQL